jgi:hypothetical protein
MGSDVIRETATRRRLLAGASTTTLALFSNACDSPAPSRVTRVDDQPAEGAIGMAQSQSPLPAPLPPIREKEFIAHPYPPPDQLGGSDWQYFRETGHYVSGGFKVFFEANGGLGTLGYPITEELQEDGWTVQYFQRARLEFRPEAPAQPVQRSLLGDMLLALYPDLRKTEPFRALDASTGAGRFFQETGFVVENPILDFFQRNGGPVTFGYPISRVESGVQWFQRARLEWLTGSVQAALIGDEYTDAIGLGAARDRAQPPRLARADLARAGDMLDISLSPDGGDLVTRLPQDAQVRVAGEVSGSRGEIWYAVRLWNALDGFVPVKGLAFTPPPPKSASAGGATPWQPPQPPAQGPFPLRANGRLRLASELAAEPNGRIMGQLPRRTAITISTYATDASGRAWVQLSATPDAPAGGWVLADRFSPNAPDPLTHRVGGERLADRVTGKGMWFTYDVLRHTPVDRLIATAKANGFAFLAPQVGTSRRGYWARAEFDALLPAAHAAGLKVIPWVYPWLADVPGDLDLTLQAANHVAPTGERIDGIGVDIEENVDEEAVRDYGQLLRAAVGPETLLVAITFQPQIAAGRRTPFGALADTFNVIAPMSYWHARAIRHSYQDAYTYVADSVRLIRERTGRPDTPIAVIGQTFDWFSRNEIGPHNPSGEEIRGAMQAAKDTRALGIGFFNWFHTTPEEWDAIARFAW